MFDVLTYQKGGALLRMLEQYLGAERFRDGVSHYLRTHAYGNTETNDLWDAIEETTRRAGAPDDGLVDLAARATRSSARRVDGDELVLRQQRFAFDADTLDADVAPTTWLVPVHVRNGADRVRVLARRARGRERRSPTRRRRSSSTPAATASTASPTATTLRDRLTRRRRSASLGTLERYNLVDDAWHEVVAGRLAGRRLPRRSSRASAASASSPCGRRSCSACAASAACSTTTPTRRFQARVARPARPRPSPSSAIRSRARTTCAASCAACSSRALRHPGRRRGDRRPRRRAGSTEAERGARQRRPRAGRRGDVDRRQPTATRPSTSAMLAGYQRGHAPRRSSCATSTRSPSSTPRRSCCARASWP